MAERFYSRAHLAILSDEQLEAARQQASAKIPSSLEGTAVAGGIGVLGAAATVFANKFENMSDGDSDLSLLGLIFTALIFTVAAEEGVKAGVNISRVKRIESIQESRAVAKRQKAPRNA